MSLSASLLIIALLVATSAFFSVAEMSMAAARRVKLRQLADEGERRAELVLKVQSQPGHYVAVVQIGLNAVAILGGIVGEGALTPHFEALLAMVLPAQAAATTGLVFSFLSITAFFIVFADLCPKRLGLNQPEQMAMRVIVPMQALMALLQPVVWVFNSLVNGIFTALGLPGQRDDSVTTDDIMAMAAAGTEAGVLGEQGQQVISNVFELETRTVESAMTTRERIVYLLQDDSEETIRTRIAAEPHSTYLVCGENIDEVLGYVDATDLFQRVLNGEAITLHGPQSQALVKKVLMVPDRLTLSEVLLQFRQVHEDFAVIINEYSLVVGVITLNDVMSTVMGDLVKSHDEEQIVRRDDGSWLIDGVTPIVDVMRACEIDELPHRGQYDTLAGFLMVMLRRIPRRTDTITLDGLRFEVLDVDSYKIDQVMVTRLPASVDSDQP